MILITGSTGLIGSAASFFYLNKKKRVIGIDNNLRSYFFGIKGSNKWKELILKRDKNYNHFSTDIRNKKKIFNIFKKYGKKIKSIIHTAAQPSHDWAAKEPFTDFEINANGTLNLLEAFRLFCPKATFVFTSTNKVYGDRPNYLPLKERKLRFEIDKKHLFYKKGINENMSLDQTTHSIFGSSKVAADILVQEYGRYFNLKTATFRGGCLTGENHSGAELHGFLSFLVKSILNKQPYSIFGYKGKQVRDNMHSSDLVNCFWEVFKKPKKGEVYNIGGGRKSNCSVIEALEMLEGITGTQVKREYIKKNRVGDHIWYISDLTKFQRDYPNWKIKYSLQSSLEQMIKFEYNKKNKK
jgi:CDP-paratose 2-epimerase